MVCGRLSDKVLCEQRPHGGRGRSVCVKLSVAERLGREKGRYRDLTLEQGNQGRRVKRKCGGDKVEPRQVPVQPVRPHGGFLVTLNLSFKTSEANPLS